MKYWLLFTLFLVSGCSITGFVISEPQLEGSFLVTKVVDGDTLDLENGERIRFSGINTPESGECYYQEAKEKLKSLVGGKEVLLEKDKSDTGKYGRKLRYVYVNESEGKGLVFVNGVLVERGYAKVYDKYKLETKRYSQLKKLEKKAIEKNLGVWDCKDLKEGCLYVGSKNSEKYHTPGCKYVKRIKPENLNCYQSEGEVEDLEFSGC
jgi:micrococcal nuclease